jgi:hypothetical protein
MGSAATSEEDREGTQPAGLVRRGIVIGLRWLLIGAAIAGLVRSVWAESGDGWAASPAAVRQVR